MSWILRLFSTGSLFRLLVAFRHRFQVKFRSACHVRRHFDGQGEGEIIGLRDEELVFAFRHAQLRHAMRIRHGPVWVQNHTSAAQRHLSFSVDRLYSHQTLGMADDSDSKTGRAFIVRNPDRQSRAPDAPRVKVFRCRGLKFELRKMEASAGPAVAGQRYCSDLCPLVIVDSEIAVLKVALTGTLDSNLYLESFSGSD